MRFIVWENVYMRKAAYYWKTLFFILILVFCVKELIIRVDQNTKKLAIAVSNYILASNNPYRIYINLDEQLMYVFKNEELYKTYPVSGGKINSPSPVGDWIIIEKGTWGDGFGGAWMGLNVPWGKYGIHGTRQPWAIGRQNVSGGCIRMNNNDANELYKFIPHGTKVKIVFENQPFRNIRDGDIGSDVYQVQKALKYLNYFHDWCNGKYGHSTKKAVMAYQKDVKLAVTGIVNISTWEKLMRQYNEAMLE